jgi:hypothetical protein
MPLLPAAMLATCVPCEPATICDCGSSAVAGTWTFGLAAMAAFISAALSS